MKIMKNIMRLLLCSVILCLSSCGNSNKYFKYTKGDIESDIVMYEQDNTTYIAHRVRCKTKFGDWYYEYYCDNITNFVYENDCVILWVSVLRELATHKRIS